MKKYQYLFLVAILTLIAILPAAVRAEEETDDVTVETSASADVELRQRTIPPPRPGSPVPTLLREQLRDRAEVIQNNTEIRNKMLENRKLASTTRQKMPEPIRAMASSTRIERREIGDDRRADVMDTRREGRDDMRDSSNTIERREIRKDMRMDVFKIRKEALIKQLTVSLNNLKQIRERISSRIDKAAPEGRNMTVAKSLLITADAKITTAISAIQALSSLTPPAVTSTTTAEVSVDLSKPRQAGETAIKAIKAANESLVAVVRAIAHAMGLGNNASTTQTVTASTTTTL